MNPIDWRELYAANLAAIEASRRAEPSTPTPARHSAHGRPALVVLWEPGWLPGVGAGPGKIAAGPRRFPGIGLDRSVRVGIYRGHFATGHAPQRPLMGNGRRARSGG